MNENVTRLQHGEKEIILIATAHVSRESADLVKRVIEGERPDSVCIELDHERYNNLQNPRAWEARDIRKAIKAKKAGLFLTNLILSSYQKKIASKLNTTLGSDMIQGIESAKSIGATLVLADRNIRITFLRIWQKLNLWEKAKVIASLLFSFSKDTNISDQDLQELLQEDMLDSLLTDMRTRLPKIGDVLITERDQYLAMRIMAAPGKKIVAVLGAAHVPGVKQEIEWGREKAPRT